jgi:RNA polymerase sigma-70 factor (ECF subfamily)
VTRSATPLQARRFESIFALHSPAILGYLLRRVQPPEDAADLMAEVFAIAWRRIDDVPPGEETRLWLYGVARNVLNNHRRGAQRRDKLAERLREELALRTPPPESGLALEVHEALAALSESDRDILTLCAWEQLTPAEIAELLGLEPGTVRARLSRARSRLRQILHPQLHAAETP